MFNGGETEPEVKYRVVFSTEHAVFLLLLLLLTASRLS